jgi:hypothetical protein
MKPTSVQTVLAIGLVATLIAFSLVTSRAAYAAVDSHPGVVAERTARECPLKQPAISSECGTEGKGELAASGAGTRATKNASQGDLEQNDPTGKLLEGLMAHDSDTN